MLATSYVFGGGGVWELPAPPLLHQLLGTRFVNPTAFFRGGKPLTQLVLEQLRG